MSKSFPTYIFHLLSLIILPAVHCQFYFSSISQMKTLPSLQKDISDQLENMVNQLRNDLRIINETSTQLKALNLKSKDEVDTFVLVNKLLKLKKHLNGRYKLSVKPESLPSKADLDGNLFSLSVLQSTYNLNINDICRGYIRQEHTHLDLPHQLMLISSYYNVHESHVYPIRALQMSIHSINRRVNETFLYKDVQTKASWSFVAELYRKIFEKLTDKHKSYVVKLTKYIVEYLLTECETFLVIFIDINKEFVVNSEKVILEDTLDHIEVNLKENFTDMEQDFQNPPVSRWNPYENESFFDITLEQYLYYAELCQGLHKSISKPPLVCYYETNRDVYYLLNPFKMEQLFLDPPIVLYRDFVTEREIQTLINESAPQLQKSMIGSKGVSYDSIVRISQNTWLDEVPRPLLPLANRIVSAVPLVDDSEFLQVNNYGIGGLYTPHLDNFHQYGNPSLSWDRLATFMIYLTDNVDSGATVFPLLNLTFYPSRGCAIFWYNIYSNFSTDFRSLHAGCPVLTGDKWVVNKWYSNREQLFRHPCREGEVVLSRQDVRRKYSHFDFFNFDDEKK